MLRDMIADRDKTIEKIQQKSQQQITREAELKAALESVRNENATQSATIRNETAERIKRHKTVIENLRAMQGDFVRQSNSLHSFCKNPTDAQAKDPNYVMRMQAQLCKAMHSMAIQEHGMELEKKHTEDVVKYLKDRLARCIDEKTKTELKHMNELLAIDVKRRNAEAELKKKLNAVLQERKVLEQHVAENEESENSEAVDEDLDDEELAAKDEMMKLLTERKAEIATLEAKLEERDITIAEMEEEMEDDDFDMDDLARARARVAAVLSDDLPRSDDEEESDEEDSDEEEDEGPEVDHPVGSKEDGSSAKFSDADGQDGVTAPDSQERPDETDSTDQKGKDVTTDTIHVMSPESPVEDSE